jgi:hypothetical protein
MFLVRFDFLKPTVGFGLDIEDTNIFFNLINKHTQLMNGGVSWRGAREIDALSLQVCVEALTKLKC